MGTLNTETLTITDYFDTDFSHGHSFKIANITLTESNTSVLCLPSNTFTWENSVAAGDWQTLFTPGTAETGRVHIITGKDDGSIDFEVVEFTESGGSVSLTAKRSLSDIQFRDNSGVIEIANNINPGAGHWLKAYTRIDHES